MACDCQVYDIWLPYWCLDYVLPTFNDWWICCVDEVQGACGWHFRMNCGWHFLSFKIPLLFSHYLTKCLTSMQIDSWWFDWIVKQIVKLPHEPFLGFLSFSDSVGVVKWVLANKIQGLNAPIILFIASIQGLHLNCMPNKNQVIPEWSIYIL